MGSYSRPDIYYSVTLCSQFTEVHFTKDRQLFIKIWLQFSYIWKTIKILLEKFQS